MSAKRTRRGGGRSGAGRRAEARERAPRDGATDEERARSLARKRRFLTGLVAALAVWPLLHVAAVRVFDLNPWNWYGWAMYTQPNGHVEATATSLDGEPFTAAGLDAAAQHAVSRAFFDWTLRRLTVDPPPPDDFAAAVLAARTDWRGVRVEVRRIGLERESATVQVLSRATWEYPRNGDRARLGQ